MSNQSQKPNLQLMLGLRPWPSHRSQIWQCWHSKAPLTGILGFTLWPSWVMNVILDHGCFFISPWCVVISKSQAKCWAHFKCQRDIVVGCILEIVVPDGALSRNGAVTIDIFRVGDTLHPEFDMPILHRSFANSNYCTVNSKVSVLR